MARPGARNLITDVAGLAVGAAEDAAARTGVTVVRPVKRAVAAVAVLGGGPGTRETDALSPSTLVDAVDAIVLSGGSVYGLAAADGVTAVLGAAGEGFALLEIDGVPKSPVVPAAILYDLANGGAKHWGATPPYRALGIDALNGAGADFALGRAGAAYGAKAGAGPGGLGSASVVADDGLTVGALVAVNSFGAVRMPGSNAFWAWPLEQAGEFGGARPWDEPVSEAMDAEGLDLEDWGAAKANPGARENTTLAVVATDAILTVGEARRVAEMAAAGLARAIRPVFTPFDGDVVFALSTGEKPLPDPRPYHLARIGAMAADTLARAVARGVWEAERGSS